MSYKACEKLLRKLEPLGYTFDYGLCGSPFNLRVIKNQNLKITIDSESISIYRDMGEDNEPIHIIYYHEDEWIEDSETVTPAIINAIQLFYTNQKQLLETLGLQKLIL